MFVSVIHEISDFDTFFERGQKLISETPPGVKPLQFLPATDGEQAVCLWETQSLEACRDHIDGMLGNASAQDYFAVEEQHALGLPLKA